MQADAGALNSKRLHRCTLLQMAARLCTRVQRPCLVRATATVDFKGHPEHRRLYTETQWWVLLTSSIVSSATEGDAILSTAGSTSPHIIQRAQTGHLDERTHTSRFPTSALHATGRSAALSIMLMLRHEIRGPLRISRGTYHCFAGTTKGPCERSLPRPSPYTGTAAHSASNQS
jgi:hypothetical protein